MKTNIYTLKLLSMLSLIVIVVGILVYYDVPMLFSIIILIWISIFAYCSSNISKHIVLLSFLVTFFTFLLGRDLYYYINKTSKFYTILEQEINNHTYLTIILAMLGVLLGYFLSISLPKFSLDQSTGAFVERDSVAYVSKKLFLITYPFYILNLLLKVQHVITVGYVASYQASEVFKSPWLVSKMAVICPVAFYVFLATKPRKVEARLPIYLYVLYSILTIFTGQRFPVIASMIFIIIYYVLRNRDEVWLTSKHVMMAIFLVPISIGGLFLMDYVRLGKDVVVGGIFEPIIDFFSVQGGSINVIKHEYYFHDQLKDIRFYSINSILTNILNINPYVGNSLAYAQNGHSLAARLSPMVYGVDAYLSGRGTGSSYIAELFHDFGYVGVTIGSFVYGQLLKRIDKINFEYVIKDAIFLLMISPLLLAPRGEFDGFLGQAFRRGNLFALCLILAVSYWHSRKSKTYKLSHLDGVKIHED